MKNKNIYLIFLVTALLVLGVVFLNFRIGKSTQPIIQDDQKPQETERKMTEAELQDYYSMYKNPFVLQIRTALNSYLNDPKTLSETVLEGLGDGKSGLNSYSSDYFRGRFVVMGIKKSLAGGEEVNILFPDKPDKVFWVWVYKLAGGDFEMRGFKENTYYTKEKIEYYINQYPQLLQNKEYSL